MALPGYTRPRRVCDESYQPNRPPNSRLNRASIGLCETTRSRTRRLGTVSDWSVGDPPGVTAGEAVALGVGVGVMVGVYVLVGTGVLVALAAAAPAQVELEKLPGEVIPYKSALLIKDVLERLP